MSQNEFETRNDNGMTSDNANSAEPLEQPQYNYVAHPMIGAEPALEPEPVHGTIPALGAEPVPVPELAQGVTPPPGAEPALEPELAQGVTPAPGAEPALESELAHGAIPLLGAEPAPVPEQVLEPDTVLETFPPSFTPAPVTPFTAATPHSPVMPPAPTPATSFVAAPTPTISPASATPPTPAAPHSPERAFWHDSANNAKMQDTSKMFSPGAIRNEYPHGVNRRAYDGRNDRRQNNKSKGNRAGRFFRAACLVVLCAVVSALATYAVLDYRVSRGDFDSPPEIVENINIVEFGAPRVPDNANITVPTATLPDGVMAAEDIYEMALTQVVGIRSEIPRMGFSSDDGSTIPVSGSGFVISQDGYILTNFHVVEIAYEQDVPIVVSFSGGEEYYAEIVGYDRLNDVALIKIEATGLNPVYIGNSDNIRVGQRIYAIGNPFGELVYTMTDGIVSALDRVVTLERNIINAFQLSAAVNSGNSGGPIYNTRGEVIGIVTAKMVRGGSVEGIGFAIPINDAIDIAQGLLEYGYIPGRAFLGITAQTEVNSGHAQFYGTAAGSLIIAIEPESAAENAGLMVGDIIIRLGDVEIETMQALQFALLRYNVGDTTSITVWRDGEEVELTVTFDENLRAGQPNRQ